jgi:hypothetical protein
MKKLLVFTLAFLSIVGSVFGAISVDSTSSGTGNTNAFTWTHNATATTNNYLVIGIVNDNNPTPNSVSVNATVATFAGTVNIFGSLRADLWYFPVTTTVNTITLSNGYYNTFEYFAVAYKGVNGVGNIGTNGIQGTYLSTTVTTTQANSWVVGVYGHSVIADTITPNANLTTDIAKVDGSNSSGIFVHRAATATGDYEVGLTGSSSQYSVLVALELKEVAGTPTPTVTQTITPTSTPTTCIAYDTGLNFSGTSSASFSAGNITPANVAGRMLIVGVWRNGSVTSDKCYYGTVTMTALGSTINNGTGSYLSVYYLANPNAATTAITGTWTTSRTKIVVAAVYN